MLLTKSDDFIEVFGMAEHGIINRKRRIGPKTIAFGIILPKIQDLITLEKLQQQ